MYFSPAIKFFLQIALLICGLIIQVTCLSFKYQQFKNENEIDFIRHNSYIVLNAIQVTPDVSGAPITNQSGRTLYKEPFKLWSKSKKNEGLIAASFNSTFVLNISPRTIPNGEGLAFILTEDSNLPENSQGQWLGIVNGRSFNGSSQSRIVAVEFDTRKSYREDVDNNHVGLDVNGIYSIIQESLGNYGVNLSAGIDVIVTIRYDGKNLNLSIIQGANNLMIFSQPIDLSLYLPEKAFVGFSGSNSNYTELNCVKSREFRSSDINVSSLLWVKIVCPIGAALLIGITFYFCWRWKSKTNQSEEVYPSIEEVIQESSVAPRKFKFKELEKATDKFNSQTIIGKGGFGTII